MLRIISSLTFLLVTATNPAISQQTQSSAVRYTVKILTAPALSAQVTAVVPSPVSSFTMGTGAIDHLPEGWSTFLENLSITGADGKALGVVKVMDSTHAPTWTLDATTQGPVTLRYSVNLKFAGEKWPPGNEQAGLWADSALFLVTKSLFVTPDGNRPSLVRFELPAGWRASTPWTPAAANGYLAPDRDALVYNSIVLGRHGVYQFNSGDFHITLALIGPAAQGVEIVRQTFEPILQEYLRIFAATPPTIYLMTLFYGDDEDGEGFESSAAFRTKVPLIRETRLIWGNHLAHELLHMWNGHQLRGADSPTSQFFQEGFTEYLSNRALLKTGMITREDLIRKMEYNVALYSYFRLSGIFDTVSVRQSGTRKYRYRFGVYNGGWAVAFALDQAIREHTRDQRSLEDFMRALYARRAMANQPWTWDDLVAVASETAGVDMAAFFASYVAGLEPLPLESAFQRLGLRLMGQSYAAEMYLIPDPAAKEEERARGLEYFGR